MYRKKCYKCYRPQSSCMCAYVSSVETQTKFVILMHPKEFKKVKNNTGFFTQLSLQNSELFIGIDFSNHTRVNEILLEYDSFILFPSKNSLELSRKNRDYFKRKKMAIFIIDATWSCAKKIFVESENLHKLEHVSFKTQRVSAYEIKQQPAKEYLSTIESSLVVLEMLISMEIENLEKEEIINYLEPFHRMIAYQKEIIKNPKSNAVRFKKFTL